MKWQNSKIVGLLAIEHNDENDKERLQASRAKLQSLEMELYDIMKTRWEKQLDNQKWE